MQDKTKVYCSECEHIRQGYQCVADGKTVPDWKYRDNAIMCSVANMYNDCEFFKPKKPKISLITKIKNYIMWR